MTDNKALQDAASAWIAALTGRGVTLAARGKQLLMSPKSAYGEMTNEERATLKQHKHAIIALVKDGLPVTVNAVTAHAVTHAVASTPTPPPTPCGGCHQAPCIGETHEHFALLHPHALSAPRVSAAALAALANDERATLHGDPFSYGRPSTPDDPDLVMLRQIAQPLPDWYRR